MIPLTLYPNEDVYVLGLNRSGLSVAHALMAGKARVFGWDDSESQRDVAVKAGIKLAKPEAMPWAKTKALVISPGIAHTLPEPHPAVVLSRKHNVPIVNDIGLFGRMMRKLPASERPKIIGITGTNGKSTTTSLIGHILRSENKTAHVGGNIGVGVFDLPKPTSDAYYVLELSSYQLELAHELFCDVAILLNLTPDHLERHGTMEAYIEAKAKIFSNQTPSQTSIIGFDGLVMQAFAMTPSLRGNGRFVPISTRYVSSSGVSVIDGRIHANMGGRAELLGNISDAYALKGVHNSQNAAAAFAACTALGLRSDRIVEAMKSFPGLPHRLEFVAEHLGIRYVNDSKATNPEAAAYALRAFPVSHWIAGGLAKQGDILGLAGHLKATQKAYLYGDCAKAFAETLDGVLPLEVFNTLDEAFWAAQQAAENGGENQTILFSPAAASFDQFANFVERGNAFKSLVGSASMAERA